MKKLFFLLISCTLIFSLGACNSKKSKKEDKKIQEQSTTTSNSSDQIIDWSGKYTGVLPCTDCPGISTIVELKNDGSFYIREEFLNKKDGVVEHRGNFAWNKDGSKAILNLKDGKRTYILEKNQIVMAGPDGNKITGSMAASYILKKVME